MDPADSPHRIDRETSFRLRLLFIAGALMLASVITDWLRPGQETLPGILALAGTLVVALPILKGVITSLRSTGFAATQFYMDQYVVLALAACIATGKYLTGGIVALVLLFGQMLEERTTVGVEMALAKLRHLNRLRAVRLRKGDNTEEETDAAELAIGDEIRIRPGEAVPADAVVLSGQALVDQSRITGESVPAEVAPGSEIFAGTANLNGTLVARVTGSGQDTVVGRVQRIIEEAKESEAPIVSLAEDYARYYTPLILLIAASVFFFTRDIERAIAVMVVSIPCAFVLASPSAMVSAIAAASRMGLLVKSVRHLESSRMTDTVVFDKTGTLTLGRLELEDTFVRSTDQDAAALLRLAAALESHSNHPVARAITIAAAGQELPEVLDFTEHHGLGLEGRIGGQKLQIGRAAWLRENGVEVDAPASERHSQVHLAIDGKHAATFMLADQVRPEARETLERLRELGITDFIMLTGDRAQVAAHIAAQTGITRYEADCLPEDKLAHIRKLRAEGRKVMVVGDGLNDAPALAEGDLGVAMGALGNDVTIHTSDVALMSQDLRRLPDFLILSARTVGIINQNLLCGFAFIFIAIALSSMGLVHPVAAAFFHEFSAFFVIFNSARLLRFDGMEETTSDAAPAEVATPQAA